MSGDGDRPPLDTLTVALSARGVPLTKRISRTKDGALVKKGYSDQKLFRFFELPVHGIEHLAETLERVSRTPAACIVRGTPLPGIPVPARRLLAPDGDDDATLAATPRRVLAIDFDKIPQGPAEDPAVDPEDAVEHLVGLLPDEFADASCWWQFTSGQGVAPGELNARAWFMLDRPVGDGDLRRWARGVNAAAGYKLIDFGLYSANQIHYLARPVLEGIDDPLPRRTGFRRGLVDEVALVVPEPAPRVAAGEGEGSGLRTTHGFENHLAAIGGPDGFNNPIYKAICSYVGSHGVDGTDPEALRDRVAETVLAADRGPRGEHEIRRYASARHLDDEIKRVLARKAREQDEARAIAEGFLAAQAAHAPVPPPADGQAPAPIVLPAFPAPAEGNAAALETQEAAIDAHMRDALHRIELRVLHREAVEEAAATARERFAAGLGKDLAELTKAERRRAAKPVRAAVEAVETAFLARHGIQELPGRQSRLFAGSVGSGRTRGVLRALARMRKGNVLVFAPTIEKADEFAADLDAAARAAYAGTGLASPLEIEVWRGRTRERPGERKGGPRMCGRDAKLVQRVQATGASVNKSLCAACPERFACHYLAQRDRVRWAKGRRVVVAAHEALFLPPPFTPDLVVIDEDVALKAARSREVHPDTVAAPGLWDGAPPYVPFTGDIVNPGPALPLADVAGRAIAALDQPGRELAGLRDRGVTAPMLEACATHLRESYRDLVRAIEEAGKAGAAEPELLGLVDRAEMAAMRPAAALFAGLAAEMPHPRDGTNGTRLELRRVKSEGEDGVETARYVPLLVARWLRRPRVGPKAELVALDATADERLARAVLGDDLEVTVANVPSLGTVWQVSDVSNSKYRLLKRPEAGNNRGRLVELIANTARVFGGSLFVCCTLELRKVLEGELKGRPFCDGVVWMNFGGERGLNAAEGCRAGIVVGREQPSSRAVEEIARAFAAASPEPFASLVEEVDGKPVEKPLAKAVRRRAMRDGSTGAAELTTHPDPWARAVLEQVREAGLVQAAGRMRMVRRPGKFLVLATSLPAAVEVDRLVKQHELEQAATLAEEAGDGLARHGASVVDPKARGARADRLGGLVGLAAELLGGGRKPCHDRNKILIRSWPGFAAQEALLRGGARGPRRTAWVLSALPPAEAFAAARAVGWDVVPAAAPPDEPAPPPPPPPEPAPKPEIYVVFRADGTIAPPRPGPEPNPRDHDDWLGGTPIAEIDRRHRAAALAQGFSP